MRSTDDADIHRFFSDTAHPPHAFFLNGTQKLDLHGQRQVDHFIEKQCAALSGLEKTFTIGICPRKCAFFVAKKLALHQVLRDRATIDTDKRRVSPWPFTVDESGCHFLAGTGIARDENRCLTARHLLNQFTHLLHRD